MVIAEAIIFTGTARQRMARGSVFIERIATSVLCSCVSGATPKTSMAATNAPPAASSGIAHGYANSVAGWNSPGSPATVAG